MRVMRPVVLAAASLYLLAGCREGEPADDIGTTGAATSAAVAAADRPYTFTMLEYPGASTTIASDVTDDGKVVGWYQQGEVVKGFLYDGGTFTSVEYPGAVLTHVTSMARDGSIVGAYRKAGESKAAFHGFLRRPSGEYVAIGHPAERFSMAQRILDDGTIVGCYHGEDFMTTMHGIVVKAGDTTVHPTPGSMTNGISPDGKRVVGMLMAEGRGFVADGDRVRHLEAPGSTSTEAWDVNASGVVVGVMVDSTKRSRGFVLDGQRWTPLEVPASRSTVAFGINGRGEIVGGWQDTTGRRRGYIARKGGR